MKKSFARVFSMLLALIMLLGMGASAETHKITLDVNGPDGLKLDGILTAGYDEDGCEQYSIENSMIGKWLLQSDGADLVFGGDQMGYYTVSAEDLSKAVTTVVSAIASQQLGEEFVILMNYIASPSYQMDLDAIVTILAGEVNRIASLAQQMGLVVIHQNGDIAISANTEKVYALIAAYLESLAQDTGALNAFANLEIFKALGVPMAETVDQLPAVLTDAAGQLKAAYAQVKDQMDGGCEIYVSAETGVMTAKYYTTTMVNGEVVYSMVENVTASDDGMKMDIVYNVNGGEIKIISEANANGASYELTANAEGQSARIAYKMDANGFVAEAVADTNSLSGEGKLVIDANGIDGKCDFTGADLTLKGDIDYDPAKEEFEAEISYASTTETLEAEIESENGDLYAEWVQTRHGKVVSDFTISGGSNLRIKGSWTNNRSLPNSINATFRRKDAGPELEGTLTLGRAVYEFYYAEDAIEDTADYVLTMNENGVKSVFKMHFFEENAGAVESVSVSYISESGSYTQKITAVVNVDTIKDTVYGEFEIANGGAKIPGSFKFDETGFEVKFSDGQMTYRLYAEGVKDYSDIRFKAGLSGEEIANPGIVMDAILFVFNANTMNGLTFDAILNTLMGYYASAAFDGKVFKLDVTADGETVSLEGKMVETENAQYIEFTGIVSGMSFEARFGMKVVDESTPCLFAEAFVNGEKALDVEARIINSGNEIAVEIMGDSVVIDGVKAVLRAGVVMESEETARFFAEAIGDQPGYKVGIYMPVTFVETENGASLSASLSMAQGDSAMEIGNATVIYEALEVGPAHMSGERLTSDMLAEMIFGLLGGI